MTEIKTNVAIPVIEKNVAIPGAGRPIKYPFDDLQVGDSFFVEGNTGYQIAGSVSNARKKFPDRKFTVRTMDGGVRVWRIA